MLCKGGLYLATLILGSLALPTREPDLSAFFDHSDSQSQRIVGGTVAGPVPHMVALTRGNLVRSFVCGGSLVTNNHVLTAAHCIEAIFNTAFSTLRATVGTNRWNSGGIHYSISRNITHPYYIDETLKNDIAFLITTTNVALSSAVQLISLNYDWIGAGVATRVNGWGYIRTFGPISNVLLELLPVTVESDHCIQELARRAEQLNINNLPHVEPHIEICSFLAFNQAVCSGDSGSPLLRVDLNEQIGIVSWGIACGRGVPDVYVRISAYKDWILQITA